MVSTVLCVFTIMAIALLYVCAGYLVELVLGDGWRFQASMVLFWPVVLVVTAIKELVSWWKGRI